MLEKEKAFLKENYNLDIDRLTEKELQKKLIEILKRNNEIIHFKQKKNELLKREIEKYS